MKKWSFFVALCFLLGLSTPAFGAYHHMGDMDTPVFHEAYPDKIGTRIDDCALCHTGGVVETRRGPSEMGNCQWCHHITDYGRDMSRMRETLNPYGEDYRNAGRFRVSGFRDIEGIDSDGDGYTNIEEINALTFPGDPNDNPSMVPAPYIIYSLEDIEAMPFHAQFLLMNTSRGGTDGVDYYGEYAGVKMKELLEITGIRGDSDTIAVFSADGWLQNFDFEPGGPNYWINEPYPEATFWYNSIADAKNDGWVDYSSIHCQGRSHGDPIVVEGGLWTILAYRFDGAYLEPGYLTDENRLGGSGPFRIVPPQKNPGYPDRHVTRPDHEEEPWPYDYEEIFTDHNAGHSPRTVVAIRIGPLPEGTTDFNWNEGGWRYVDNNQIVVYGNLRNGAIEGFVRNVETGDPVQGALVKTDMGGYLVFTNEEGYFKMSGVVSGRTEMEYTVTVSKEGFNDASQTVVVSDGSVSNVDLGLTEKGDDPPSPCALSFVSADNQEILSLFRSYRDNVMAKSSEGKAYIKAYYRHAPELILLSILSPSVRGKLVSAMREAVPVVKKLLEGEQVDITQIAVPVVDDFMSSVRFFGSRALNRDLLMLKNDLTNPSFIELIK